MKKITLYFLLIIGICFIIPIFFTTKFKTKEVFVEEETPKEPLDIEKYSYTDFNTIKLLHKDGSVEEVRARRIYSRSSISRNTSRL